MKILLASALLLSTTFAVAFDQRDHEIGSITTVEIKNLEEQEPDPRTDWKEQADRVIAVGKEVVALGEKVYELINNGRPTITTAYEPISVLPRDPSTGRAVEALELEGFSLPIVRNFRTSIKSATGSEVAVFDYRVVYSYGGSYNGKGKYLTGINIIPGQVKAKWGWNINSTMKLASLMNHGSKTNPVAGVMLTVHYTMKSLGRVSERNDSFAITGNGQFQSYVQ